MSRLLTQNVDFEDLKDLQRRLGTTAKRARQVYVNATNRSMTATRKRMVSQAAEELTLKKSSINSRVTLGKRASVFNPSARINVREKSYPNLLSFKGTKPTPKSTPRGQGGLVAQPRTGKREVIPNAFINKGRGGNLIALRRPLFFGKVPGRYPIVSVSGPSVIGAVLQAPGVVDEHARFLTDRIVVELEADIDRELAKR